MMREDVPRGGEERFPVHLMEALDSLPGDVEAAFSGGDLHRAEELLQTALRNDPFNAKLHAGLGRLCWRQGRTEDSLDHLLRALELDPDDRDAVMACVEVMRAFGKVEDARLVAQSYWKRFPDDGVFKGLLEALQKSPGSPPAKPDFDPADFLNERGEQSFKRGRLDHAAACFEMALEENPSHAVAHSNLGIVRWYGGDPQGSLECLYKALDLKPDDPDILHNCIEVLQSVGETVLAKDLMRFYLQSGHGDASDWDAFEKLLAASERLVWSHEGLSEKAARTYAETANALAGAGDIFGALEAFDRSVLIGHATAETYLDFARTLDGSGADDKALGILEAGLLKFPSNDDLTRMWSELTERTVRSGNGKTAEQPREASD